MPLNKELAAVLRSARAVRSLSQEDLGDASDRKHLWLMESARSSPTLNKFNELAKALHFNPVTLLALCISLRDDASVDEVLELTRQELEAFTAAGGNALLAEHFAGDGQSTRTRERQRKLEAVLACKRQGLSQKATGERLGIPRSTVSDLWKLDAESP